MGMDRYVLPASLHVQASCSSAHRRLSRGRYVRSASGSCQACAAEPVPLPPMRHGAEYVRGEGMKEPPG